MKSIKTSIVILTKNRAKLLSKNLSSLSKQNIKPWEIIIINNNSNDNTSEIIKKYKRFLPIKSYITCKVGYSRLYNIGINKTKGSLIIFLDDDCIAKKNWLEQILTKYKNFPNSIIQGQTYSLPKNNIYAQIMGMHYQNWLKSNMINNNELRFLDNKNMAIPKNIINKFGSFSNNQSIGSEDLELGVRLRRKGIKIIFQPNAVAWHYERTNLKGFILQHYRIAQSESHLDKSFKLNDKIGIFPSKKTYLNLISFFKFEANLINKKKFVNAIKLPFLYLFLFIIRFIGYAKLRTK